MQYSELSSDDLKELQQSLESEYNDLKAQDLKLNMSRGKPAPDQLTVSLPLLDSLDSSSNLISEDGTDCSNYGNFDGIIEARRLMAEMMGTDAENVIVMGNSSLNIMFDQVSRGFTHGYLGCTPWSKLDTVKFLCPVPGYDRHFMVTEHFGVEMINVPMTADGPDMDMVERLVSEDDSVKGIWCVPKYSNPTGYVYSDETIKRLASLKPKAADFRIFYDNAYCVHDLYDDEQDIPDIVSLCKECGNPDIVFEFSSTSKISFPGGGIAAVAASPDNLKDIKSHLKYQTIGHDKINQLRHVLFFKDGNGIRSHMKKHAEHIRPKFEKVLEILSEELDGLGIGEWTDPKGGYFISFDSLLHCADRIYELCKDAGVTLTNVGATFPYGKDPANSNLRIAPTFPTMEELETATKLFALTVKLASVEILLNK